MALTWTKHASYHCAEPLILHRLNAQTKVMCCGLRAPSAQSYPQHEFLEIYIQNTYIEHLDATEIFTGPTNTAPKSFSPSVSKIPRYWGSLWWGCVPTPMLQRCSEAFVVPKSQQESQTKHCPGHLNYQVWPYQISLRTHCLLNTARDEQVKIIFFSKWTTSLT